MERKALPRLLVLTVLVMALVSLNVHPAVAADRDDDPTPRIAAIQTEPQARHTAAGPLSGGNGRSVSRPP